MAAVERKASMEFPGGVFRDFRAHFRVFRLSCANTPLRNATGHIVTSFNQ